MSTNIVNVSDMNAVIARWGQPRSQLIADIQALSDAAQQPPPPPTLTLRDPIVLNGVVRDFVVNMERIVATGQTAGILVDNNAFAPKTTIAGSEIIADSYAAYILGDELHISGSRLESREYYALRTNAAKVLFDRSTFVCPKHSVRMYGFSDGHIQDCTINAKRWMLGGGVANEWISPLRAGGTASRPFPIADCAIACTAEITIYANTHYVNFYQCDFAGTDKIFIDDGATNILFIECKNLPTIQYKNLTQSQWHTRGVIVE